MLPVSGEGFLLYSIIDITNRLPSSFSLFLAIFCMHSGNNGSNELAPETDVEKLKTEIFNCFLSRFVEHFTLSHYDNFNCFCCCFSVCSTCERFETKYKAFNMIIRPEKLKSEKIHGRRFLCFTNF